MEDLNRKWQDIQADLIEHSSLTEEQVTDIALAIAKANISTEEKVNILDQILMLEYSREIIEMYK
tara:strand:- start:461 stop:655 length:195 start_codon:yes stop_codon:yes gene_type:complete